MSEKVLINSQNKGTIECPQCNKAWEKDFSKIKDFKKVSGAKCKCPCGHTFPIVLDRRRDFRKVSKLTGSYVHDKTKARGLINITNISKSGIALELNTKQSLPKGDILLLKFNLDDSRKSYMCKEAVIKKTDGSRVGLEFRNNDQLEELESYLNNT